MAREARARISYNISIACYDVCVAKMNPDDFRIRPGAIRTKSAHRLRPFVHQAMAAAQKAGAQIKRNGTLTRSTRSNFGRGRRAAMTANRLLTSRSRNAVVKARVVRHTSKTQAMATHLRYLRRDGVTRDGEQARMFGPETDKADVDAFAEACRDDRHHFRFIVSPEDAAEMTDLRSFTRDLMTQAQSDLGTSLNWVGIAHWNTHQPHVHIIMRGVTDQGEDLVISRDYIKSGLRARAQDLITQELGLRTDLDIERSLERQVAADRFTQLDRQLLLDARTAGFVDLATPGEHTPDLFHRQKIDRIRKLEALGLADQFAPGQWILSGGTEATLRALGERGDIIKRIHRGLSEADLERGTSTYVLAMEGETKVSGRLLSRGLDDEVAGTAFVIIDGVDGRTHHVSFSTLDTTGDYDAGSIVEVYNFAGSDGRWRTSLTLRSDLSVGQQIKAGGATWLDKVAMGHGAAVLAPSGFGAEVRDALQARGEHLVEQGLASRSRVGFIFARDMLKKLRARELSSVSDELAERTGLRPIETKPEGYVSGTYRRRISLASGRFAMLDDGLGFQLVPWSPSLESRLGQVISGAVRANGSIAWDFARQRDLGL